jgi:DUF3073 family protein
MGACPGSTCEGVDAMGRGRQKAKQTKVARELKYFSPDTDYGALQRELANGESPSVAPPPEEESRDDFDDDYADWSADGRR